MNLTPSKLALAVECGPALALPGIREAAEEASIRGTVIHDYLYAAKTANAKTALEKVPARFVEICQKIDIGKLLDFLGGDYEAEVAFAWNQKTDTGRILGKNIGRNYQITPDEIPGSLDALRWDPETKRLRIADWKTGISWIEHPKTNPQLRCYALMAARAFGALIVEVLIVVFDEDGRPMVLRAEFDEFDLDAIAHEVRTAMLNVERHAVTISAHGPMAVLGDVVLGPHCTRCPAQFSCPGKVHAGQALMDLEERGEEITAEKLALAWVYLAAVNSLVERWKKHLKPMVEAEMARLGGPMPLPNGKVVKVQEAKIDSLDLRSALRVCERTGISTAPILSEATLHKTSVVRAFNGDEDLAAEFIGKMRDDNGVETKIQKKLVIGNADTKGRKK